MPPVGGRRDRVQIWKHFVSHYGFDWLACASQTSLVDEALKKADDALYEAKQVIIR